jgi:hypothetical protein
MHPFFATLYPNLTQYNEDFSKTITEALQQGQLHAGAHGEANPQDLTFTTSWHISHHNNGTHTKITNNNFITQCQAPEAKATRGTQQGLLDILVLIEALHQLNIHVDHITLDTAIKKSLHQTRYHAPRQGFNFLAKANSDLSKEIQHKCKNTQCQFSSEEEHKNDTEYHTTTSTEEHIIPHQPNHNIVTPAPPSSKYQFKIDGTTYNYLPEALIHRRSTIPPFKNS